MSTRRTAGTTIVDTLMRHGVDTIFGIPGVQTYEFFEGIRQAGDRMKLFVPRHEQTCGYMAFGYARSTGKEGIYSVVPGPGVLNAGAALCSAYGASTPILCVTGEVPSAFIGSGLGHLHELPDQLALLNGLTKWSTRIDHASHTEAQVTEAFRQMRTGRPRPTAVSMPWDVFTQTSELTGLAPFSKPEPLAADGNEIERAAAMLKDAKNPMIMVGSGAYNASAEVLRLAEALQAPVVPFRSGKGIVAEDLALGFNCASGYRRWKETDVVIGIGSRMELQWFRWPKNANVKIINIDVDPRQMVRLKADIGLVGDAGKTAMALAEMIEKQNEKQGGRKSSHAEFTAVKEATTAEFQRIQPQVDFLKAIRDVLPRDGFFTEESSQVGFTSIYALPMYQPRTYVSCGHQGTLGFGFPTSLGVKVGNPDKCVVSCVGDGGFMFGIQELTTAAANNINLVTVLFNNSCYGNVLRDQQRIYNGQDIGSKLQTPDFRKLADGFGVSYFNAATPEALRQSMELAFKSNTPCLVEVPVPQGSETSPWDFLTPK